MKYIFKLIDIVCAALVLFAVLVGSIFIIGVGFRLAMKLINYII